MENQQRILPPPPILPPRNTMDDIPQHIFPRKRKALQPNEEQPSSRTTEQAITALNNALSLGERRKALELAKRTFSHDDTKLHDYEISLGADKALCLKLGYVVVTTNSNTSSIFSEEIDSICNCLLKIYRCSSETRNRSFKSIGGTELVPLLIQLWTTCILSSDEDGTDGKNDDSKNLKEKILLSVTKVLRIFAKMDSAKSTLIRQNRGVWIEHALEYINNHMLVERSKAESMSQPYNDTLADILGLVKDLSFRSHHADKDVLLRLKGGILQKVLTSCCTTLNLHNINSKLAEWFTAVFWNLVLDKACCYQLLQNGGRTNNFTLIEGLLKILTTKCGDGGAKRSCNHVSKSKRNAVSALGNILADSGNHEILFSSSSIRDKLSIVSVLIQLVENDSDSIVRRRAMRTLRCLASSSEPHVKACFDNNGEIPSFLVDTISRNVNVDDENDRDMQLQACSTVSLLLDTFELGDWPRLETAILQRIEITIDDPKLTAAMCRCLVDCVKKSPWRRGPTCFSEMFWKRLENAVSASSETHEPISMLFLELAKLEVQVQQQSVTTTSSIPSSKRPTACSVLTTSVIVNAMTSLLSNQTHREQSRDNIIDVLLLLLKNDTNKRPLAENEGLLSALVNVCLMEQEGTRKDMAKKAILELVPEL